MTRDNSKLRGQSHQYRPIGVYSDANLDAIVEAGGEFVEGKDRDGLRDALDRAVRLADLDAALREKHIAARLKVQDFRALQKAAGSLLKKLGVKVAGEPRPKLQLRLALQQHGRAWARRYRAKPPSDERERSWRRHGSWPSPVAPVLGDEDIFGESEDLALIDAVRGAQRLRTWAMLEANRLAKEPPPQSQGIVEENGRPWRRLNNALIGRFADVYEEFFGCSVGWGRPEGDLEGPGVEFLCACMDALGMEMTPGAAVRALSRLRGDRR